MTLAELTSTVSHLNSQAAAAGLPPHKVEVMVRVLSSRELLDVYPGPLRSNDGEPFIELEAE